MGTRQVIRLLKQDGWYELPRKSTRHRQFKHPKKPGKVTVVDGQKDVPPGTLNNIMKQAGLK